MSIHFVPNWIKILLTRPLPVGINVNRVVCAMPGWRAMSGGRGTDRPIYWFVHYSSHPIGTWASTQNEHWSACTVQPAEHTGESMCACTRHKPADIVQLFSVSYTVEFQWPATLLQKSVVCPEVWTGVGGERSVYFVWHHVFVLFTRWQYWRTSPQTGSTVKYLQSDLEQHIPVSYRIRCIYMYTVFQKKFTPRTFMITVWNENQFK